MRTSLKTGSSLHRFAGIVQEKSFDEDGRTARRWVAADQNDGHPVAFAIDLDGSSTIVSQAAPIQRAGRVGRSILATSEGVREADNWRNAVLEMFPSRV